MPRCVGESLWVLSSEPGRSQHTGGESALPAQTHGSSEGQIYGQVLASASTPGSPPALREMIWLALSAD